MVSRIELHQNILILEFLTMHIEYTSVKLAGQSRTGLWKLYLQSIIYQKHFPVT